VRRNEVEVRILSWNIQWGRGCDRRVDFDRVADVIRRAGEPEVVCLQEVAVNHPELPGSQGEDQIAELAARFPGCSTHFAIGTDLLAEDGRRRLFGNLILSRLPVLEVFRHALPWPADPICPNMPRIAIEAVVAGDGAPLRVLTTHLEYHSARQRMAQVVALRRLLAEGAEHTRQQRPDAAADAPFRAHPRPSAVLLCGDFNCPPESPEYRRLLRSDAAAPGLLDAWRVAHPDQPHAHTVGLHGCDWPDHPYCCDYFLVSPEVAARTLRVEVDQQTDASDHQPVWIELH
jgi:endonuclease/exonuclease/phosphatase family metal-dependent hydrolase